jgi:hypothetical protein
MCQILNSKFKCQIPNPKLFWIWAASILYPGPHLINTPVPSYQVTHLKPFNQKLQIKYQVVEIQDIKT